MLACTMPDPRYGTAAYPPTTAIGQAAATPLKIRNITNAAKFGERAHAIVNTVKS
jgi:hypothetical protein